MKHGKWRTARTITALLMLGILIFTLSAGQGGLAAGISAEPETEEQNRADETETEFQTDLASESDAPQDTAESSPSAETEGETENMESEPSESKIDDSGNESSGTQAQTGSTAETGDKESGKTQEGSSENIQDSESGSSEKEPASSTEKASAAVGGVNVGQTADPVSEGNTEKISEESEKYEETEETLTEENTELLTEETTELSSELPVHRAAGTKRKVTVKNAGNLRYASYGLGSYTTGQYRVTISGLASGAYGFCANPVFPSPTSGTFVVQTLNSYWLRIMYYGLSEYSGGNNFFSRTGRAGWPAGKRYIIIHLSIAQRNKSHSLSMGATSGALSCADALYKYAGAHETPTPDLSLTPSSVTAYKDGDRQRTPSMTLNGFVYNYVTISLPAGVSLVNETKNTTSAPGETVNVYGKDKFYLTAPLDQALATGKKYSSGKLAGHEKYRYAASRVSESPLGKQDVVVISRKSAEDSVSFEVNWLDADNASIHIKKTAEALPDGKEKIAGITFTLTWTSNPSVKVTLVTDDHGEAGADHLKPGTYTIRESGQSRDYAALPDATVTLENNKTLEYSVRNVLERRNVKIQKLDSQTEKLITADRAVFQILNADKEALSLRVKGVKQASDTFSTDENGEIEFDDQLSAGQYILHELRAPANYRTAADIPFTVNADSPAEIVLRSMDTPIMKKIRILKKSEDGGPCGAGFRFVIRPAGKITDGTGQERQVQPQTVTTDENGTALSGDLYPGTYTVTETAVPEGSGWIVSPQTYTVEIRGTESGGSRDSSVNKTDPSALYVTLTVTDAENRLIIFKHTDGNDPQPLENITFSLTEKKKGAESIYCKTGKDGRISIDGLAGGRTYQIRETETLPGYNLDPTVYEITVDETGLIEGKTEYMLELSNQPNIVRFSKKDITAGEGGDEIPGAGLVLKDNGGKTVDSWTSTEQPHEITALPAGEYELTETIAPAGYEISEQSIHFTVKDSMSIQKVIMYDKPFRNVDISKSDVTTGEELPGASLTVTDDGGNVMDEWVSTDKPHRLTLPSGVYTLTEKIPASGYVTAKEVTFEVKTAEKTGDREVQRVDMKDAPTKVYIHKQDITTSEEIPGARLQITDKDGRVMETWTSTDQPHYMERLPFGTYTLTEIAAPDGYEKAESISFEVVDSGEIKHVVMKDSPSPRETEKTDETADKSTPDAASPATGDRMPAGRYLLTGFMAAFAVLTYLTLYIRNIRQRKKKAGQSGK